MMAGRGRRATPRKDQREDLKPQLDLSRCISSSTEHDPTQLFFTNLLLLGFDADRLEAETRIPFNKSMFNLPNKRGAEYVLHFLLTKLDPVICKKEFRDCWPVSDKKQEQRFRSVCYNWISAIAKEPDAHLPRINATILMSPGGSKFISFIMHFSRYVLYKVDEKENDPSIDGATTGKNQVKEGYPPLTNFFFRTKAGVIVICLDPSIDGATTGKKQVKERYPPLTNFFFRTKADPSIDGATTGKKQVKEGYPPLTNFFFRTKAGVSERLEFPVLTKRNNILANTLHKMISCATVRSHRDLEDMMIQMINHEEKWTKAANNAVKEIRKLSKEIREKEHRIREETLRSSQLTHNTSSTIPRKASNLDMSYDYQASRRAQDVQEVRGMWQQIDNFCRKHQPERDVVESIVDRAVTKHRISAADITIKVSDLLLRECAQEIRRNHIENTYQNGKLNLVSLLQLWNLSMKMFIERYHQAGVPDFTNDVETISDHVHKHHGCLSTLEWLGEEISKIKPEIKVSVEQLLRRERERNSGSTPVPQTRTATSVGMGLIPPSPQYSFSPQDRSGTNTHLQRTPQFDSTPDAVLAIRQSIAQQVKDMNLHENAAKEYRIKLFNTPSHQSVSKVKTRNLSSNLPQKSSKKPGKIRADNTKITSQTVDVRDQIKAVPRTSHTVDVRDQIKALPRSAVRPVTYGAEKDTITSGQQRDVVTLVQEKSPSCQISPDSSAMSNQSDLSRTLEEQSVASSEPATPQLANKESPSPHSYHLYVKSPSDYIVDEVLGLRSPTSPLGEELELFKSREIVTQTTIIENRDMEHYGESSRNLESFREFAKSDESLPKGKAKDITYMKSKSDSHRLNFENDSPEYESPLEWYKENEIPGLETNPQRPDMVSSQRPDIVSPQRPNMISPQRPDMVSPQRPDMVSPRRPDMVSPQRSSMLSPQGSDKENCIPEQTDFAEESDKGNKMPEYLASYRLQNLQQNSPNSDLCVELPTQEEEDVEKAGIEEEMREYQRGLQRSWHLTPSPVSVHSAGKNNSPPAARKDMNLLFTGFDTDLVKGEVLDDIQEPYLSFSESPHNSIRKFDSGTEKFLSQSFGAGDSEKSPVFKSHSGLLSEKETNPMITGMSDEKKNLSVSSVAADVNSNLHWISSEKSNVKRDLSLEYDLEDLEDMESTMKSLDDLLGKSQDNNLSPGAVDIDLDDSFVPLKEGFQLEGCTPQRQKEPKSVIPGLQMGSDNEWLIDISPTVGEHSTRDRESPVLQTLRLDDEQESSGHWARIQALREKTKRIMESMAEHDA